MPSRVSCHLELNVLFVCTQNSDVVKCSARAAISSSCWCLKASIVSYRSHMLVSWSCARAVMGLLYMCTVELQLKIIWDVVGVFCSLTRDYLSFRSTMPCFLSWLDGSIISPPTSLCRLLLNRLVRIVLKKGQFFATMEFAVAGVF